MNIPRIELRAVGKSFAGSSGSITALEDVSFGVMPDEFVTVIGPSGSGKSTLLNMCAGLVEPDLGEILIDGQALPRRAGALGYMPQRDLLFPWRSVLDNAVLSLEIQGVSKAEARERARGMLVVFGLDGFEKEYPEALSGGMRQRAALLRTWLTGRQTLLLDEPFGALDAITRRNLQDWLLRVWSEHRRTILFITHDVEEAVYLSDRVLVMSARPGRVKGEIPVTLPRPRRRAMVADSEFVKLEAELLAEMGEG
ncbi:MAG: ABC transporter ATP-binding protein [Dehalococcoidia bacterium]|nr:ABC transporter ATP-binding protein [Dehalococcoidia bacterium]